MMAFPDTHPRIEAAIGHPIPAEHSVHGLAELPAQILGDAVLVYEQCGSLHAFAYLYHVTDAEFGQVKEFCAAQGWSTDVDD